MSSDSSDSPFPKIPQSFRFIGSPDFQIQIYQDFKISRASDSSELQISQRYSFFGASDSSEIQIL